MDDNSILNDNSIKLLIEREHRLSSILNNIDVGLLLQGPNSEIFLSNDKTFELLGLTEAQLLGLTSLDPTWNVIKEDGSEFLGEFHPVPQAIATKKPIRNVVMGVYRPISDDRVWLLVNAIPLFNDDGSIKHVVCSFIDISEEKKAKDALNKSHKELSILYNIYKKTTENINLKDLFNNAITSIKEAFLIDGVAIYTLEKDSDTLIFQSSVGFSDKFIEGIQFVKKGDGLAGRAILLLSPVFSTYEEYPAGHFKFFLREDGFKNIASIPMIIGNKAIGAINIAFKQEKVLNYDELELLIAISRQLAIAIENAQLVESLRNELQERFRIEEEILAANETISKKNQLLSQVMSTLEIESKTDPLTSLYNRRYMLKRINQEILISQSTKKVFSIIIADIDFYKSVNDTYGHDLGDYVLKYISNLLKSNLREIDCLSRWGGDEFLILLTETELPLAQKNMERLRKKVENQIIELNNKTLSVTMTFGVSVYYENSSIDDVIKRADNALYEGKKNGRNCVVALE